MTNRTYKYNRKIHSIKEATLGYLKQKKLPNKRVRQR